VSATAAAARVAGIEAYGVAGNPPRPQLLALVELAAQVCHVPSAALHLITASEQIAAGQHGDGPLVCPLEESLCAAVVEEPEPVFVTDASRDPRFCSNPFVDGRRDSVRCYAAQPLVTPAGVRIGALCLAGPEPRSLTAEERRALATLAARAVDVLELDRRTAQLAAVEGRLRGIREELRRANDQLAVFAGQAAHDLRNPLTSVSMSLQLLQEQRSVLEDADARWMVGRALTGAERMQALIEELVGYAQVGGQPGHEPVEVAELVGQVRADLADVLAGATLVVEGELPVVCGDRAQLAIVLANLVTNAVRFSAPVHTPVVTFRARPAGSGWRLEVADNGPGVPVEERERVFEPLVRLDKSVPGAGLGLSVCRRIVRAHGGSIGISEGPAGGTLVWLELPDADVSGE